MSDNESAKGFAALSGMVSDGAAPAENTSDSAKYQMIALTKNPSMAAPWSSDGPGEGWQWGDYYITVQTRPDTFFDSSAKMAGKNERMEGLSYLFSATVFRDPQKNEFGPSSRPALVIAIEKSEFGTMVGVFDGDVRSNMGGYVGTLDVESARATFFDFIGKRFELFGHPQWLGTMEAVREKVVTRKISEIIGNGTSGESSSGLTAGIPTRLLKGKRVPIVAALAVFATWGLFAKPNALSFVFGYESFDECVLDRMKGQPSNLLGIARSACRKSNPPEVEIDSQRLSWDFCGNDVCVTSVPTSVTLTKITLTGSYVDCREEGAFDSLSQIRATAYKPAFSSKFVFDIDTTRFKCTQLSPTFYGIDRN